MRSKLRKVSTRQMLYAMMLVSACMVGGTQPILAGVTEKQSVMQVGTVEGLVIDTKGEPLIGASVLVKGTTNGTTTDMDGKFRLNVAPGATLVVTYIGYVTAEVIANDKAPLTVTLKDDSEMLDEVVVVGYGTQRKSDLTGAITSIKATELTKISGGNATEALQGKVGVHILNVGAPGSSPVVRIRGVGSNTNSNPLYVVDGMFVDDIQFLNQHDILSMEVLKDASATAIYGSRGANGVILVTTKKGSIGKTTVNVSGSEGFQFLSRKYDVADASEYAQLQNIVAAGRGNSPDPQYANPSSFGKGTNWVDETTQNGWIRDYQASISGGSENCTFNASVGWLDQEGVMKYTDYSRFTARLNNTYKIHKRINVGHNITFTNSKSTPVGSMASARVMNSIYTISPLISPRNDAGEFNNTQDGEIINPYAALYYGRTAEYKTMRFVGNVYADIDIMDGLTFRSSYGFDYSDSKNKVFEDSYSFNTTHQTHPEKSLMQQYNTGSSWLWENTLTYNKEFEDHRLNVMAGYTMQESKGDYVTLNGTGLMFNDPDYTYLVAVPAGGVTFGSDTPKPSSSSIVSALFRANYTYKDRYLVTASFRADGSSKFQKDNRWGYFPAFALGWRVSEEGFLKNSEVVNNLKLRASWGQIGNDKVGDYLYYPIAVQDPVYNGLFNGVYKNNFAITKEVNKAIKWERAEQLDLGFNYETLNNRLSLEFDWFKRDTKDLLYAPAHPGGSTGLTPATRNIGQIRNKGVEFSLGWNDKAGDFNYNIRFSGSHFKNEVVDFDNQVLTGGEWMSMVATRGEAGYPLWYFYGYQTDGVYQTQADMDKWNEYAKSKGHDVYHPAANVGDLIYVDVNGDGYISGEDQTKIGDPYPDFTGSLLLNADYKGFDISIDMVGVFGFDIYNNARTRFNSDNSNMHTEWLNAWTPENTRTDMPRLVSGSVSFANTSFNVQKGNYIKIRSIELGYSLPKSLLARISVERLRIYLNATNPFYITGYKGFSPEVSSGVDFTTYPVSGSAKIGFNLTF